MTNNDATYDLDRMLKQASSLIDQLQQYRSFFEAPTQSDDELLTDIMDDADREAEMLARKRAEEEKQARYEANTHNLLPFAQFLSNRGLIDEEPADIIAHYADVCEIRYQRGL